MEEKHKGTAYSSSNLAYNNASVMEQRLSVESIFSKFEKSLRGQKEILYTDEEGNQYVKTIQITEPLLNETGIHQILIKMNSIINAPSFQGNIREEFWRYKCSTERKNLARAMFENVYTWGIKSGMESFICNNAMNTIELVLTRPINNLERMSYADTMKTVESNTIKESGGLKIFNKFKPE